MDSFDLLCTAFMRTNLNVLLGGIIDDLSINNSDDNDDDDDGTITLYAPTNYGMEIAGLNAGVILTMDATKLADILKTHITKGSVTVVELVCDAFQGVSTM
jgi:hypothetical protein